MTRVLRQITDAKGNVIQVQEDEIAFADIPATPNVIAIQDAPTPSVAPSSTEPAAAAAAPSSPPDQTPPPVSPPPP